MPKRKLYAGAKLRELRGRLELTQKSFAEKLGVSLPYLNQMENNNRPISAAVVLSLSLEGAPGDWGTAMSRTSVGITQHGH